jgi:hypothetical protein
MKVAPKKKERTCFEIDFSVPPPDESVLFAVDKKRSTVVKNRRAQPMKNLLPRDVQYSWKDLLQLFTKPAFEVCTVVKFQFFIVLVTNLG